MIVKRECKDYCKIHAALHGKKVLVEESIDGKMLIRHNNESFNFNEIMARSEKKQKECGHIGKGNLYQCLLIIRTKGRGNLFKKTIEKKEKTTGPSSLIYKTGHFYLAEKRSFLLTAPRDFELID